MNSPRTARKARNIIGSIAVICSLIMILAVGSALAIRLLEMGDDGKDQFFLLRMLDDHDPAADAAARNMLWVYAVGTCVLAIISAIFAIATARRHGITSPLILLLVSALMTFLSFMLAWPLGAVSALVPLTAIICLPLSSPR